MSPLQVKWLEVLPWPQIWIAMSWESACWIGNQPVLGGVKIAWNEDLLKLQVTAEEFFRATKELRSKLEEQLGERFEWQVSPHGETFPHQLFLYSLQD